MLIMPRKWTKEEERRKHKELVDLYVEQEKTIFEIADLLGIAFQTVYDRLKRFEIPTRPEMKGGVTVQNEPQLPSKSGLLAEFVGIVLGDGHISSCSGQIHVYLNFEADGDYVDYVKKLLEDLFSLKVGIIPKKGTKAVDIFVTSVKLIRFLRKLGLSSSNKVKDQTDVPGWIWGSESMKKGFLRGFFDTDGSIYRLKFGVQMSFNNRSLPLLVSTREILLDLNFHPSSVSSTSVYLTRKEDLKMYVEEVGFSNQKHLDKAKRFGIV